MLLGIFMNKFLCAYVFRSLRYESRRIIGSYDKCINFENYSQFFKAVAPFYSPINSGTVGYRLPFYISCLFHYSNPRECKVLSPVGFIGISIMNNTIEQLFLCLLTICLFLWRNVCSDSLPSITDVADVHHLFSMCDVPCLIASATKKKSCAHLKLEVFLLLSVCHMFQISLIKFMICKDFLNSVGFVFTVLFIFFEL
jgi:hypothetical protein